MKEKIAFGVQWHITSNCLNRCTHCYMYQDGFVTEDCCFEDFVQMYRNLVAFEDKYQVEISDYTLTGGSPLMNPDAGRILRFLSEQGKKISLLDIPEMVTEENIRLMQETGVKSYQMSLDGLEQRHNRIRGEGSFAKTIQALKKLEENGIKAHIMFTISPENRKELLPLCRYLQKNLKCFSFAYDFLVPIGNAQDRKDTYFSEEAAKEILDQYYIFALTKRNENQFFVLKPSQYRTYFYARQGIEMKSCFDYPVYFGCHIGWDSVSILQNGDVLPCRRLPIVLGNLKRDRFEDIFLNSDLMRKFRRFQQYQSKCGTCLYGKACRGCPAIVYAVSGDPFGAFPLCEGYPEPEKKEWRGPELGCSSQEEFTYIKKTLRNQLLADTRNVLWKFPNLRKEIKAGREFQGKEERAEWIDRIKTEMGVDEMICMQSILKDSLFEEG